MARVEFTAHLSSLFPALGEGPRKITADSVRELVSELERSTPGIAFYLCDERGRLRRHVNVFVDGEMIVDRPGLSDRLDESSVVFIAQSLSGG